MSMFGPDTWSGKMSPVPSAQIPGETSQRCLKKQSVFPSRKPPLWMCLKKDGLQADASSMSWENGALPGEFSMRSFGESPSAAVESHLSQILEDSPHPRFSLSAKACRGIINRANKRGKKLPDILEAALKEQSHTHSKYEADVVGGGKGALVQEDKSATLSTLQDQTLFHPVAHSENPLIEMTSTKNTIITDGICPTRLRPKIPDGGRKEDPGRQDIPVGDA